MVLISKLKLRTLSFVNISKNIMMSRTAYGYLIIAKQLFRNEINEVILEVQFIFNTLTRILYGFKKSKVHQRSYWKKWLSSSYSLYVYISKKLRPQSLKFTKICLFRVILESWASYTDSSVKSVKPEIFILVSIASFI